MANIHFLYHFFHKNEVSRYRSQTCDLLYEIAAAAKGYVKLFDKSACLDIQFSLCQVTCPGQEVDIESIVKQVCTGGTLTTISGDTYSIENGLISISCTPVNVTSYAIKIWFRRPYWDYLKDAVEPFTEFQLRMLADANNRYVFLFYAFLCTQPETFEITEEELRNVLGVKDKYRQERDLKNKVLLPVKKGIEPLEHSFSFKKVVKNDRQVYIFKHKNND